MRLIVLVCAAALIASAASAASYINKEPDLGPYWLPLCNGNYTYIYADTFTMPDIPETTVSDLGMWLAAISYYGYDEHSRITMEIWETDEDGVPLFGTSLCTTDFVFSEDPNLVYVEAPVVSPVQLTPGVMYAFVANAWHDFTGYDAYQVGGHTQGENPGYFFYSNEPETGYFDGQFYTPEMAFRVTLVPEPGLIAPFAGVLLGLGVLWRRR